MLLNIAETKWIVVGLYMMPFSDFRYFVSVLKSFSMLLEVKCSGIESSAAFAGFIFLEVGFCLLVFWNSLRNGSLMPTWSNMLLLENSKLNLLTNYRVFLNAFRLADVCWWPSIWQHKSRKFVAKGRNNTWLPCILYLSESCLWGNMLEAKITQQQVSKFN